MVKYQFPFRWIPGEQWEKECGQLFVLDMDPEIVRVHVSIDSRWCDNSGVVREIYDAEVMHVRHALMETLDAEGRLQTSEKPIHNINSIRCDPFLFWSVDKHISRFEELNPDFRVVAFSSNGNCGANPYYIASDGRGWLHLRHEVERGYKYSFILGNLDGFLGINNGIEHNLRISDIVSRGNDVDNFGRLSFTSGIPLVENGKVLGRDRLLELIREGKVEDLGHIFLFGHLPYKESWVNLGYNAFFTEGRLDYEKIVAGVMQYRLEGISVGKFNDDDARRGLESKGYRHVHSPRSGHPGEFYIKDGKLDIVFLPGLYSHSMFGMTNGKRMISAAIRALSNRAGGTDYLGSAEIMAELGCVDAVLCDNGGDVVSGFKGQPFFTLTEQINRGLRSVLIYAVPKELRLKVSHVKPITYPPQYQCK